MLCIKPTGDTRGEGADDESDQLVAGDIDAENPGDIFIVGDRVEHKSHPGLFHHHRKSGKNGRQGETEKHETHAPHRRCLDAGYPDFPTEKFLLAHDADKQENHAHGRDREKVMAYAQAGKAYEQSEKAGKQSCQWKC